MCFVLCLPDVCELCAHGFLEIFVNMWYPDLKIDLISFETVPPVYRLFTQSSGHVGWNQLTSEQEIGL